MKKLIYQSKKVIYILIIPYLFIIISSFVPLNVDITAPGYLNPVPSVIKVDIENEELGSFNTVSVYTSDRTSLLKYLLALANPKMDISPSSENINLNLKQNHQSGTIQKDISITNALIASYTAANRLIEYEFIGQIIHTTTVDCADGLKIGDIITKWQGNELSDSNSLKNFISNILFNPGDRYDANILRANKDGKYEAIEVLIAPQKASDQGNPYLGLYLYDYYQINHASPSYQIQNTATLGPSGGLMQALSIYNSIVSGDLTAGLKIAGTGTIDIFGNIGAIGGVEQKIITAHLMKADLFFIPVVKVNGQIDEEQSFNYVEAKKAYAKLKNPQMKLVPVAHLLEAIAELKQYG